jgi:hypothetical protein
MKKKSYIPEFNILSKKELKTHIHKYEEQIWGDDLKGGDFIMYWCHECRSFMGKKKVDKMNKKKYIIIKREDRKS